MVIICMPSRWWLCPLRPSLIPTLLLVSFDLSQLQRNDFLMLRRQLRLVLMPQPVTSWGGVSYPLLATLT